MIQYNERKYCVSLDKNLYFIIENEQKNLIKYLVQVQNLKLVYLTKNVSSNLCNNLSFAFYARPTT